MIAPEQEKRDFAADEWDLTHFPLAECASAIWKKRRWLGTFVAIITVVAIAYSLSIPNEYTSTGQLMPIDAQTFSSASMLSALNGPAALLGGGGNSLLNQKTPAGTAIAVLGSATLEDAIINRFNLREVYHVKLDEDARKQLATHSAFEEDKKSGILSISVTDTDRYRARDIAKAYVEELGKLVNSLSISSARRERVFLEERLSSIKNSLDTSSHNLSQFSSRNATVDPQKEGEATIEAAEKLQAQLIADQSQLSGLKAMYSDDNVRVRSVRAQISELQSELRKMTGMGEEADGSDLKKDRVLPSVRQMPLLGYTYYELSRQVTLQEALYETLSKQYELAKVQEAKEIPPIKVLDQPSLPERKSRPHRLTMALIAAFLSTIAGLLWIVGRAIWEHLDNGHPLKAFAATLRGLSNETRAG